jgi:hypothetical protein
MERPQEHHEDDLARRRAEERDERDGMGRDGMGRDGLGEDVPGERDAGHPAATTATAERDVAEREGADESVADGGARPGPMATGDRFELFGGGDAEGFRQRWESLQAGFVDDPRGSTEQADALVGEVVERVSRRHRELRDELGRRSDEGGDTEAMRLALRQYRELFAILVRS